MALGSVCVLAVFRVRGRLGRLPGELLFAASRQQMVEPSLKAEQMGRPVRMLTRSRQVKE